MKIHQIIDQNYLITDILDLKNYPNIWNTIIKESNILSGNRGGRKMCRMTDPGLSYTLNGRKYPKKNYTKTVKRIQHEIEEKLNIVENYFNTCTMNYYPSNKSGFRAHTDYMKDLAEPMIVTMLTLGESNREIEITNHYGNGKAITLPHNSLVLMGPNMQRKWFHGIPKSNQYCKERLSLSFRRQRVSSNEQINFKRKSKSLF